MHGGGDLVGLHFLAVDPGAGLLGDRREFLGGAGQLADAVADPPDQLAQAVAHALHDSLQLAQFVAALEGQGILRTLAEVAGGDGLGLREGFVQRPDDLPVDRPAGDAAEGQGQRGDQPEAGAVAAGGALAQLATGFGEGPAGPGHILGAALHRLLRLARADDAGTELLDAATIALEAAHGLFQRRIGLAGQLASQRRGGLAEGVERGERGLLGLVAALEDVAAHLVTHHEQLLVQVGHRTAALQGLRVAGLLREAGVHQFLEAGEAVQRLLCSAHQHTTGGAALLIGCGEVVEGLAVGFDGFGLVGQGGRVKLAVAQRLQALEHPGQGLADLLGLARVAAGFECQAALFGLLGLFHQAGDFGELLAEGGLVREGAVAADHHQQKQREEDTETDHQLAADAQLGQLENPPIVHRHYSRQCDTLGWQPHGVAEQVMAQRRRVRRAGAEGRYMAGGRGLMVVVRSPARQRMSAGRGKPSVFYRSFFRTTAQARR